MLHFISDELRITFRCCGSSTLSLVEVVMGETDGYVALGDSTYDVIAGPPMSHTIDWGLTGCKAAVRMRKRRVRGKGALSAGQCRRQPDAGRSRPWLDTGRLSSTQLMKYCLHCVIAPRWREASYRYVAVSLLHGSIRRGKTGKGRHRICLVSAAVSWTVLLRRRRSFLLQKCKGQHRAFPRPGMKTSDPPNGEN